MWSGVQKGSGASGWYEVIVEVRIGKASRKGRKISAQKKRAGRTEQQMSKNYHLRTRSKVGWWGRGFNRKATI